MTDEPDIDGWDDPEDHLDDDGMSPEPVRTGVGDVDTVIAAVEGLEERPLEEHVGVYETAHEQLRRALDTPSPTEPS